MTSNSDLGFLGGGQLARMSIQAAQRLGLRCVSLDLGDDTPASEIAPALRGSLSDSQALAGLLRACERVTLENEFVPASAVREACELASFDPTRIVPSIEALETVQDKLMQKQALEMAGVPCPHAAAIEGEGVAAIEAVGFPLVLKARFGGYDGKGTRYARDRSEFDAFRTLWGGGGWMAEPLVEFKREIATMVYLSESSEGAFPTMETIQKDHVCDLVFPANADASEVALAAARAMGSAGLFGIEMFELEGREVLVNEIAPRPHNSGHYTLDWGGVSQFEQHVRIAMGLPLAEPSGSEVCMANLLGIANPGSMRLAIAAAMSDPGVFVHWYGKAECRPGRKMGHLNAVGADCLERARSARQRFYEAWSGPSASK
jgi:5-(carboxyamino)imidazole ribonucleotide synthase